MTYICFIFTSSLFVCVAVAVDQSTHTHACPQLRTHAVVRTVCLSFIVFPLCSGHIKEEVREEPRMQARLPVCTTLLLPATNQHATNILGMQLMHMFCMLAWLWIDRMTAAASSLQQ
jgi:hypothetical protein